jgi:hypothetical protein
MLTVSGDSLFLGNEETVNKQQTVMQIKISHLQRQLLVKILSWTLHEEEAAARATDPDRAAQRKKELETLGIEYRASDWASRLQSPPPTAPSISRALSRLEERGLVARRNWFDHRNIGAADEAPRGARTTHVLLTDEGRAHAEAFAPKTKSGKVKPAF